MEPEDSSPRSQDTSLESFSGDRLQWNVLGQSAASKCEGLPMLQGLPLSLPSRCCWWLGRTKTDQNWLVLVLPSHQQHPEGGDGASPRNAGKPSRLEVAVCLRLMFTRAHHVNIHFNITSHPSPGLSSGLFPSAFPTRMLYTPLLYPACATCPICLILFDLVTQYLVKNVKYDTPHYSNSSSSLLPHPS